MDTTSWNTFFSGVLIVGLTVIFSTIGVFVVRRLKSHKILSENNEFAGITYPVVGLVYGVFLAFTIIIAWEKFSEAEHSAIYEVTHLSELWRNAQVFPAVHRDRIQEKLYHYVRAVKDKEWLSMAEDGKENEETQKAYESIWMSYYSFEPKGSGQEIFFAESITHLNEVGQYRRQRIMFSSYELPGILWVFVIAGGIITTSLNYLIGIKSKWSQIIINALIAALIAFSIFLIASLQHPFTGDVNISNAPFESLLVSFDERKIQQNAERH